MLNKISLSLNGLRKSKKALSPAISAVFLMGIFTGAVAASTIIIIPNIQRITDEGALSQAESNLRIIDQSIQNLVFQEFSAIVKINLEGGGGSSISTDNASFIRIVPIVEGGNLDPSYLKTIKYNRVVIKNSILTDILKSGEHKYTTDQTDVALFSINPTNFHNSQLSLINVSRESDELVVSSILSYKLLFENSFPDPREVITNIKLFKFNLIGKNSDSLSSNSLSLTFDSVVTTNIFSRYDNTAGNIARINLDVTLLNDNVYRENSLVINRGSYFWTVNLIEYVINIEL